MKKIKLKNTNNEWYTANTKHRKLMTVFSVFYCQIPKEFLFIFLVQFLFVLLYFVIFLFKFVCLFCFVLWPISGDTAHMPNKHTHSGQHVPFYHFKMFFVVIYTKPPNTQHSTTLVGFLFSFLLLIVDMSNYSFKRTETDEHVWEKFCEPTKTSHKHTDIFNLPLPYKTEIVRKCARVDASCFIKCPILAHQNKLPHFFVISFSNSCKCCCHIVFSLKRKSKHNLNLYKF